MSALIPPSKRWRESSEHDSLYPTPDQGTLIMSESQEHANNQDLKPAEDG